MNDAAMPAGLLARLKGCRVYSVEFVLNDYVQFRFDGGKSRTPVTLNSYVWPVVEFAGRTWREEQLGYADALRRLTPGIVLETVEQAGLGIRIDFDTGSFVIHPRSHEVQGEIAEIMGWDDRAWMVWRPGEEAFEDVAEL